MSSYSQLKELPKICGFESCGQNLAFETGFTKAKAQILTNEKCKPYQTNPKLFQKKNQILTKKHPKLHKKHTSSYKKPQTLPTTSPGLVKNIGWVFW